MFLNLALGVCYGMLENPESRSPGVQNPGVYGVPEYGKHGLLNMFDFLSFCQLNMFDKLASKTSCVYVVD